jgi:3-hydroxypropanoate dehydrogenase
LSETIPESFHEPLDERALDQTFRLARTRQGWTDRDVPEALLRKLYDTFKFGPTSANICPGRFVWVRSVEGRAKLSALASDGNKAKIIQAPVTVIIGYDLDFGEQMPILFPSRGETLRETFRKQADAEKQVAAFRNGTLQGAYLIIAARALGLDCGPMSGFDNDGVDKAFFSDTRVKSNFICSLGYGSNERLFPRNPRLSFEQAGRFG